MADINTDQLSPCPNCGGRFEPIPVGLFTIDRCASCAGLWLDERELEKVLSVDHSALRPTRTQAAPDVPETGKKGKCPRCGGTLIHLTNLRANVVTDSCSVCYGVFLDAGELDRFDHPNLGGRAAGLLRKLFGRH